MPRGYSSTLAGGVGLTTFKLNRPAGLENHYVVGSGVGRKSAFVRRALRNRASNNAQGEPCCMPRPPTRNPPHTFHPFIPNQFVKNY